MNKGKLTRAFTLIELLTVIAIIGILAAILIPVAGKVRESGFKAADINNLRQLGQAVLLFAADHDDHLPTQPTGGGWWPSVIYPYVESTEIFYRPGADYNLQWDQDLRDGYYTSEATVTPGGEQIRWWYWINGPGAWQPFTNNVNLGYKDYPNNTHGRPMSTIEEPGRTIFLANGYVWNFVGTSHGANERFYRWSNGKTHFLWLDGHVDARGPDELTQDDFAVEKGRFN